MPTKKSDIIKVDYQKVLFSFFYGLTFFTALVFSNHTAGWGLLTKKTATTDSLVFRNVPTGGLYQLKLEGSEGKARIFLYNDAGEGVVWM